MIIGPATPGFLFTLAATGLLAVVSFSVPNFKSVYFLEASIQQSGASGSVTFGVLGYCLDFEQVTCSKPSVGWEFDPNTLLGNDLPIEIPNVVVKWITYALVLHIVALGLAGVSAVFGLLAHIREFTMSCFSSCISGCAAAVCLIAFIFDLVLFFLVRARVNSIQGGSATIGNALWLTLAAWVLLFFSGCAFAFGRCCCPSSRFGRGSSRRRRSKDDRDDDEGGKFERESERMRLDAVKAEADRKARQKAGPQEVGLPAFHEYERAPLRRDDDPQYYEEEVEVVVPYTDHATRSSSTRPGAPPGRGVSEHSQGSMGRAAYRSNRAYEPGAPGTRAVDDYFNGTAPMAPAAAGMNTYPPPPQPSPRSPPQQRQPSGHHAAYSPPQQHVDPYLAVASAGAGYSDNRGYGGDPYVQQQYPSRFPAQDPYATSGYNPNAAPMSPPQPTHCQDNSGSSYVQQGYGHGQDQRGHQDYDPQQAYNQAAQQMYAQPEPHRANPPAQGYDPYEQQGYDSYARDPYAQQPHDPYAQQPHDPYAQQPHDPYAQQAHDPYAQRGPSRQPTMPQSFDQYNQPQTQEPARTLVASPSPLQSPAYSPRLGVADAAVAAAGSPSQPAPAHMWSGRSDESAPEAPPPQYEPTAGASASAYPVEKH